MKKMKHSNSNREKNIVNFRIFRPQIVYGVKQNKTFVLKVILIFFLFCGFVSCNTEDRNIKKALKEHALLDGTKYKLTEYRVIETILKTNIEDSIQSGNISVQVKKRNDEKG